LVYFIWTGLTGFYRIFILSLCQFPEETNKAKSTCGGKKLQLSLHMMYPDYPVYPEAGRSLVIYLFF